MFGTQQLFHLGEPRKKMYVKSVSQDYEIIGLDYLPYREIVPVEEVVRNRAWLFERTIELGDTGCWLWKPVVGDDRKFSAQDARRLAFKLFEKPVGNHKMVRKCNEIKCVRPSHFELNGDK